MVKAREAGLAGEIAILLEVQAVVREPELALRKIVSALVCLMFVKAEVPEAAATVVVP